LTVEAQPGVRRSSRRKRSPLATAKDFASKFDSIISTSYEQRSEVPPRRRRRPTRTTQGTPRAGHLDRRGIQRGARTRGANLARGSVAFEARRSAPSSPHIEPAAAIYAAIAFTDSPPRVALPHWRQTSGPGRRCRTIASPRTRSRRPGRRDDRIRVPRHERRSCRSGDNWVTRVGHTWVWTGCAAAEEASSVIGRLTDARQRELTGLLGHGLGFSDECSRRWVRLDLWRPRSSAGGGCQDTFRVVGCGFWPAQRRRVTTAGTERQHGICERRLAAEHPTDVVARDARRGDCHFCAGGGGRLGVGSQLARATGATGHRGGGAGPRVAAHAERPVGDPAAAARQTRSHRQVMVLFPLCGARGTTSRSGFERRHIRPVGGTSGPVCRELSA
jgi:hypothetical protein